MGLTFQKELNSHITEYLVGVDKLKLIDKLLTENEPWRKEAFLHVRKLLYHMVKKKASDMDLGGYRAKKRIWYRTFGTKKPEMEVPSYGVNETNIMALAIISEAQKEIMLGLVHESIELYINSLDYACDKYLDKIINKKSFLRNFSELVLQARENKNVMKVIDSDKRNKYKSLKKVFKEINS